MDFLEARTDSVIRKEIKNIKDSYHHYWDILAELLQNSRDSISRKKSSGCDGPYFIKVLIDSHRNSIAVFDNGAGMSRESVTTLLGPGGTDKESEVGEVGEKGVGLTYAIFSSNKLILRSKSYSSDSFSGSIHNAYDWLSECRGHSSLRPEFIIDSGGADQDLPIDGIPDHYPKDSYFLIELDGVASPSNDENIFSMTKDQLLFLLRTRTAVGVTDRLHSDESESEFKLFYEIRSSDVSGSPFIGSVPSGYPIPHVDLLKGSVALKYGDMLRKVAPMTSEDKKRKFLKDKSIWTNDSFVVDNWGVKVYGIMFNNNTKAQDISRAQKLLGPDDDYCQETALFKNSIVVATKGMPTGIELPAPTSGQYPAYYKRCFFLVEADDLPFDVGRKTFHYRYTNRLKSAVSKIFDQLVGYAKYQQDERGGVRPLAGDPLHKKAEEYAAWESAKKLADLDCNRISFMKQPGKQEASVAAIFHELIGADVLGKYRVLQESYHSRYDCTCMYGPVGEDGKYLPLVIEFKYSLESIVSDFSEGVKALNDISLLVAWDADEGKLSAAGFHLYEPSVNVLDGVTHELEVDVEGVGTLYVILLRHLIRDLRQEP